MTSRIPTQSSKHLRPRKALGQHFLADTRVLARIVNAAEIGPSDVVLEIGAGRGALTRKLVDRGAQVIAVELDPNLAGTLAERLGNPSNLTVVEGDARRLDPGELVTPGTSYKVAGNLPYYAANPIIRRFLEAQHRPTLMVLTLQEEVARNIAAAPGKMGFLSAAVQYYASAKVVCTVPPRSFRPPPKVTSAVVRLDVLAAPAVEVDDGPAFLEVVKSGFRAPRKQLRNSLAQGLGAPADAVEAVLKDAGMDPQQEAGDAVAGRVVGGLQRLGTAEDYWKSWHTRR